MRDLRLREQPARTQPRLLASLLFAYHLWMLWVPGLTFWVGSLGTRGKPIPGPGNGAGSRRGRRRAVPCPFHFPTLGLGSNVTSSVRPSLNAPVKSTLPLSLLHFPFPLLSSTMYTISYLSCSCSLTPDGAGSSTRARIVMLYSLLLSPVSRTVLGTK